MPWTAQGSVAVCVQATGRSGLKCTVPCAGKQHKVWGHCAFGSLSSVFPLRTSGMIHFLSTSQDRMCAGPVS